MTDNNINNNQGQYHKGSFTNYQKKDITYEINERLGIISEDMNGWTRELNLVNFTKMIAAVKGMSSNLLRQIDKYETDSKRLRKLFKQIDTVKHYADMVGFLQWTGAIDLNSLSVHKKYHDFYYSEDAIDNALISDAKSELKKDY